MTKKIFSGIFVILLTVNMFLILANIVVCSPTSLPPTLELLGSGARWASGNGNSALFVNWKDNYLTHHLTDGISWQWPLMERINSDKLCISTALNEYGFEVDFASDIPTQLSSYDVVVISAYFAAEPIHEPLLRNYISGGGGLVLLSGVPTYLVMNSKTLYTTTHIEPIQEWFGASRYYNTAGYGIVSIDHPGGSSLLAGDQLVRSPFRSPSAIVALQTDTEIWAKWNTPGYVYSFTHEYGSGRIYYQSDFEIFTGTNDQTSAMISIDPNPVDVDEPVSIVYSVSPPPPSGYTYEDCSVHVIYSDGTELILDGLGTETDGSGQIEFTPNIVGETSVQFIFPGQTIDGTWYQPCSSGFAELNIMESKRKALLINCYPIGNPIVGFSIKNHLNVMGFSDDDIDELKGDKVTADSLIEVLGNGYDVIWWRAHGDQYLIQTGEPVTSDNNPWEKIVSHYSESWEIPASDVINYIDKMGTSHGNYVGVKDDFISKNFAGTNAFQGSLIYIEACETLKSEDFVDAFKAGGALVYLGYESKPLFAFADFHAVRAFNLFSRGYDVNSVCSNNLLGDLKFKPNNNGDFKLFDESPNEILDVTLHSPANLFITDSLGRSVGVDPTTGDLVSEIPDASYYGPNTEPQFVMIHDPLESNYLVQVVGTGTGKFTVDFRFITPDGTIMETMSGEIAEGAIYQYEIHFDGESLEVVPDPISDLNQLKNNINELPDEAFNQKFKKSNQKKTVISSKIDEVILKVQTNQFDEAINKLSMDIRKKMDGNRKPVDWIISPTEQEKLCIIIDHIISTIETL